jgi:hypothetical protein
MEEKEEKKFMVDKNSGNAVLSVKTPVIMQPKKGCMIGPPMQLANKYLTIFSIETTVVVIFIPVVFFMQAGMEMRADAGARLCIADKELAFSLVPTVGIRVSAGAGINLFGFKGGIGMSAVIVQTSIVPMLSFGITGGGALRVCLSMRLVMVPLAMQFYAWYQLPICFEVNWKRVGTTSIPIVSVKQCEIVRCIFFSFALPGYDVPLFSICSAPLDTTPPTKGFASCKQVDGTSLQVNWGGFIDKESSIDHNEVSVGSLPGRDDIFSSANAGAALSYVVTGIALPQLAPYFCSVKAVNGEEMARGVTTTRQLWSAVPVMPVGVRVQRSIDGLYVGAKCGVNGKGAVDALTGLCEDMSEQQPVYLGAPDTVAIAFRLGNTNPSVNVSRAEWAVCGEPNCVIPDLIALPWTGVGRGSQLAKQSRAFPIAASATGLNLTHGYTYYASVSLYQSSGLLGYSKPSAPIVVDLTPPEPGAWAMDGPVAGEDVDFAVGGTTTVFGSWAPFVEDFSPVAFYTISIVDAFGGIIAPPVDVGLARTASADAFLLHGVKYFLSVTATNEAGLESVPMLSNGFTADVTPPFVWPVAAAVLPWATDSWLADLATARLLKLCPGAAPGPNRCAQTVLRSWNQPYSAFAAASGLPAGAPNGTSSTLSSVRMPASFALTATTGLPADAGPANFTDATSWGIGVNQTLASATWVPRLISPETALVTMRLRWACGDPDSDVGPGPGSVGHVLVAAGFCPGCLDALGWTEVPPAVGPFEAPAASWLAPEAYLSAGAFRAVRFGAYFDAVLRVPVTANNSGQRLYGSVQCVNGAGAGIIAGALPPVLLEPVGPTIPDASKFMPGLAQGARNWAYTTNTTDFAASWRDAVLAGPSGLADGRFYALNYSYIVHLGTSPGADDLAAPRRFNATVDDFTAWAGLSMPHNTTVYATLEAGSTSVPPVFSTFVAPPVLVDLTPPVVQQVSDGAAGMAGFGARAWSYRNTSVRGLGDVNFLAYAAASYANWVVVDPESGVEAYVHAAVDALTNATLAATLFVGQTTSVLRAFQNMTLAHGQRVRNVITAWNRAGLNASGSSDGFAYDSTPPAVTAPAFSGVARVLPPGSLLSQPANASIPVINALAPFVSHSWASSDDLSGVPECWWALGTYVGGDDQQPWTSANASGFYAASAASLGLVSGATYFPTVQCVNGAGLGGYNGSAAGVGVDLISPFMGRVLDGNATLVDRAFASSTTSASVSFPDVVDLHTALRNCSVAFGYNNTGPDAGLADVSGGWVAVPRGQTTVTATGLAISPGRRLFANVRCEDLAGNAATAASSGIVVDVTPPVMAAPILTGLLQAIDPVSGAVNLTSPSAPFTASLSQLGVRFAGIADPESGVAYFHVAISTSASAAAAPTVRDFQLVGAAPFFLATGLALTSGRTYFVLVRAFNGAGLNATFVSPGILVDASPPTCSYLRAVAPTSLAALPGDAAAVAQLAPLVTSSAQAFGSALTAVYQCSDPESGVASAAFAVGFFASDASAVPLTPLAPPRAASLPADGTQPVGIISVSPANLTKLVAARNGASYIISLVVYNGAGSPTVLYSGPVTFDGSAPGILAGETPASAVFDGPDASGAPLVASNGTASRFTGSFRLGDLETGVASLTVALAFFRGSAITGLGLPAVVPALLSSASDSSPSAAALRAAAAAAATAFTPLAITAGARIASGSFSLAIPASLTAAIAAAAAASQAPYTVFAVLNATNRVGISSLLRTGGVVVDLTPPVCSPLATKNGAPLYVLDGLGSAALEPKLLPSGDVDVTPNGGFLAGRWSCTDRESGVAGYEAAGQVRAGSGAWGPAGPFEPIGSALSGTTRPSTGVSNGPLMRLAVNALNRAGRLTAVTSDGVLVDPFAPVIVAAAIAPPPLAGRFTGVSSSVGFLLGPIAPSPSGLAAVSFTLGTRPGAADIAPTFALNASQVQDISARALSFAVSNLSLVPGVPAYLTVTARSSANIARTLVLPPLVFVNQGPTAGTAAITSWLANANASSLPGFPLALVGAYATVSFSGWSDGQAGISSLYASFVQTPAGGAAPSPASFGDPATPGQFCSLTAPAQQCSLPAPPPPCAGWLVQPWAAVDLLASSSAFTARNVTLCPGWTLTAAVRAVSFAGMSTPTVVSAGAPVVLAILSPSQASCTVSANLAANTLSAAWPSFTHNLAGVRGSYSVCYGARPGDCSLSGGWLGVAPANAPIAQAGSNSSTAPWAHSTVLVGGALIADGSLVFATVSCTDSTGTVATTTSPGVLVDTSPPVLAFVLPSTSNATLDTSAPALAAAKAAATTYVLPGRLFATVACADANSGLRQIAVSAGTSAGGAELGAVLLAGAGANVAGPIAVDLGASLADGDQAFVTVVCTNNAGGIARSVSAPVIADGSPPVGAPLDSSLFGPAGIAIGGAATAALRSAVANRSSEQPSTLPRASSV